MRGLATRKRTAAGQLGRSQRDLDTPKRPAEAGRGKIVLGALLQMLSHGSGLSRRPAVRRARGQDRGPQTRDHQGRRRRMHRLSRSHSTRRTRSFRTEAIETGKEKVIAFPGAIGGYIFWRDSPGKAAPTCLRDSRSPGTGARKNQRVAVARAAGCFSCETIVVWCRIVCRSIRRQFQFQPASWARSPLLGPRA